MTPTFNSNSFACPHCGVVSQQTWFNANVVGEITNDIVTNAFFDYRTRIPDYEQKPISAFLKIAQQLNESNLYKFIPSKFAISTCKSCNDISIWIDREIVHPRKVNIPSPNLDMSEEIKELYIEASRIYSDSARGATALLRLALQLLLKQIGKTGKDINNDIKELVASGLSPKIQQALDLVRVVGNNAVHPGQIDLTDDREIALKLFKILNFIAEELISKPKELEELYANIIPEETQKHIDQRDKVKQF